MKRVVYVGLFVGLLCLLNGSIASVMARNLNVNDESKLQSGRTSAVSDQYLPLAATPCVDGMAGDYPCENVDLMAFIPFAELGSAEEDGSDIWGWTDPNTGDEYAIMTMSDGTSFVRITDPENPVVLGFLPTHTVSSNWHDAKVFDNYAFIVSEAAGHGMQVFDLTQLSAITATASISPTMMFTNTAHYGEFGNAHNIVINEDTGYAYAVGTATCEGGLHFVNINDPLNPVNEGCFDADGYTHDAQCVIYNGPDTEHVGKEICLNANEDTLTIVDVTDKSAPVQLSRIGYDNASYTHQGWLTEDQAYFLLNDELDEQNTGVTTETYVWDVTDLDAPFIETIYTTGLPSIDHNLYTWNDSAFLSNYTSGLRVLNISDPTAPVEIGYFDVHPETDGPVFTGTWSNYPYFDSGTVVVSSIDRGLFILRPQSFSIQADTTMFVSCDGSAVTTNVNVYPFFDAADDVTLVGAGVGTGNPSLGTVFFGADIVPIGSSSEVTLTPPVSGENSVFTITGMAGDTSSSTEITIIQNPPTASLLSAPLNFGAISSFVDTFSWEATGTATSYLLEVSDTPDFANVLYSAEVATTSHTVNDLPANQVVYWRVSAINECGSTPSAVQTTISLATSEQCSISYTEDFETEPEEGTIWSIIAVNDIYNYYNGAPLEDIMPAWQSGADGAYSGASGWYFTDTKRDHQTAYMPAATFDASTFISATFKFWQQRNLGADDVAMVVPFSYDTFTYIPITNDVLSEPYDTPSTDWPIESLLLAGESFEVVGWSGVQDWTETTIDVTPYIGNGLIEMNFLLFLGDDPSNEVAWAIDDVSLEVCAQLAIPVDLSTLAGDYGTAWHGGDGSQYIGTSWSEERVVTSTDTSDDVGLSTLDPEMVNSVSIDAAQDGWLMGWFDWNGDGQFGDDELIIDQSVISGANNIDLTVPEDVTADSDVAYRLRVTLDSESPVLSSMGFAADGEVEDGFVLISSATATTMGSYTVNAVHTHTVLLILLTLMLVGVSAFMLKRS